MIAKGQEFCYLAYLIMFKEKDHETTRIHEICNGSLLAGIKCAEEGQPPCETCDLKEDCEKIKKELDELWKQKI